MNTDNCMACGQGCDPDGDDVLVELTWWELPGSTERFGVERTGRVVCGRCSRTGRWRALCGSTHHAADTNLVVSDAKLDATAEAGRIEPPEARR
jgi:hypothetical protein